MSRKSRQYDQSTPLLNRATLRTDLLHWCKSWSPEKERRLFTEFLSRVPAIQGQQLLQLSLMLVSKEPMTSQIQKS